MTDTLVRYWNGLNLAAGLLLGSVELGVLLDRWMYWS